jgi:hypothetical protein
MQLSEHCNGQQQDKEIDCGMYVRRCHQYHWENFKREDYFLHVVLIAENQSRRHRGHFGKGIEHDQAAIYDERQMNLAIWRLRPARAEDAAEDEGKCRQHQQGIKKRPADAHIGTTVFQQHVASGKLPDQVTLLEQIRSNANRIQGCHADSPFIMPARAPHVRLGFGAL